MPFTLVTTTAILTMQIGGSASTAINCGFCAPDGRAKSTIGFKRELLPQQKSVNLRESDRPNTNS
jgi:hypothetical protein